MRIAEALKSNKTLRFFDLEVNFTCLVLILLLHSLKGCHIGAGVVDVAQALANHETLAYINLSVRFKFNCFVFL